MRFVAQAHVAGAPIYERWNANGYVSKYFYIHYISACASASDRRFPSIRECISALKYWLHGYGVNFLLDFIFNIFTTGLSKYLFNFTSGNIYITMEKNDRTRWTLFLWIASGKHTSHTCSYISGRILVIAHLRTIFRNMKIYEIL